MLAELLNIVLIDLALGSTMLAALLCVLIWARRAGLLEFEVDAVDSTVREPSSLRQAADAERPAPPVKAWLSPEEMSRAMKAAGFVRGWSDQAIRNRVADGRIQGATKRAGGGHKIPRSEVNRILLEEQSAAFRRSLHRR